MRRFVIRFLGFELLAFEAEELQIIEEDEESPAHFARTASLEADVDPEIDDYAIESLHAKSTAAPPFGFSVARN